MSGRSRMGAQQLHSGQLLPLLICVLSAALGACTPRAKWTEDVLLPDGRIVTLTRYQEFGGATELGQRSTESDYWLEFKHPETGEKVRWESNRDLATVALFIHEGTPYLLTTPGFGSSLNELKCPNPPYLLYLYKAGRWIQSPLADMPIKRLRANMSAHVSNDVRDGKTKRLSAARTSDSYVLNNKPWLMDFSDVHQTFEPGNCNHELNYLLVSREGSAP